MTREEAVAVAQAVSAVDGCGHCVRTICAGLNQADLGWTFEVCDNGDPDQVVMEDFDHVGLRIRPAPTQRDRFLAGEIDEMGTARD